MYFLICTIPLRTSRNLTKRLLHRTPRTYSVEERGSKWPSKRTLRLDVLLLQVFRGTSLKKHKPLLSGPYNSPLPRALCLSWGGWRCFMSEIPLYGGDARRIGTLISIWAFSRLVVLVHHFSPFLRVMLPFRGLRLSQSFISHGVLLILCFVKTSTQKNTHGCLQTSQ